jgi:hypothetical protein
MLLAGDLGFIGTEDFSSATESVKEVERMLKALIKSVEKKTLDPLTPRHLDPFCIIAGYQMSIKVLRQNCE